MRAAGRVHRLTSEERWAGRARVTGAPTRYGEDKICCGYPGRPCDRILPWTEEHFYKRFSDQPVAEAISGDRVYTPNLQPHCKRCTTNSFDYYPAGSPEPVKLVSGVDGVVAERRLTPELKVAVLARDKSACVYCGGRPPQVRLHIDHAVPRHFGGSTTLDNLVTACVACNCGKGARYVTVRSDGRWLLKDAKEWRLEQETS